ncbi:MAG TPA: hypothetical protein VNA30_05490 [Mycobacteriales bacterium]|nr:hypothetical protein [Mycobacteriales bacterium]
MQPDAPLAQLLATAQEEAILLQADDTPAGLSGAAVAERQRVADVLDALADGQGELLHAQDRAAGELRRQLAHLMRLLDESSGELASAAEAVRVSAAQVGEQVTDRLKQAAADLDARVEAGTGRVEAATTQGYESLEDAAGKIAQQVTTELGAQLRADIESTLTTLRGELTAIREEVASDRDAWRHRIARTMRVAETTLDNAVRRLETASTSAVDGIEHAATVARSEVTAGIEELAATSEGFRTDLEELLAKWEQRDLNRERRYDTRIARLVERTEDSAAAVTAELKSATARLEERDRELEAVRADEFARVLEDLLSRTGRSGRDVRSRVRRSLSVQRSNRLEEDHR